MDGDKMSMKASTSQLMFEVLLLLLLLLLLLILFACFVQGKLAITFHPEFQFYGCKHSQYALVISQAGPTR